MFDTARAYGHGRGRARPQRAAARPRSASLRRGGDRANRDEGRHDAARRRLGAGRPREDDPRRLRGEPRRARRPADRPLPPPRARPADPVAHLRSRAGPARRRRARARVGVANVNRAQLDEALELAPIAAVQVALSPFDDRALRGGVVERCEEAGIARDRPLSARRPAPGGTSSLVRTRWPRSRDAHGGERGGGRARVAARPLAGARPDPRRETPGDGALRRPRCDARARRRRSEAAGPLARVATAARRSGDRPHARTPRSCS